MKNLRQKNPELKALQQQLKAPAESWLELDFEQQTELCLKFLALPQIRTEGYLAPRIRHTLAPSAADLAPQVSQVLQEFPGQFRQLQHLLEQTIGLYLLEN